MTRFLHRSSEPNRSDRKATIAENQQPRPMTTYSAPPQRPLFIRISSAFTKMGDREGMTWGWHIFIFFFCVAAMATRRLALVDHPTFYAEDGSIWYLDAYNFGWLRSLASPAGGYLNTLPRLIAAITLLVPFSMAPLMMNLVGITLQALPVNTLLLRRSNVWGPLPVRMLMALVYVVLPNVEEIHVVITNAQFHLALIAFLLIVAHPPEKRIGRVPAVLVLTISGLTGPFCFALLPLAAIVWWNRRDRWSLFALQIEGISVVLQALELWIAAGSGRPVMYLGATLSRLLRIVGGQVFVGALLGFQSGPTVPFWILALWSCVAIALLIYCLRRARLELKLLIVFSALLLGAALKRPLIWPPTVPAWITLLYGGGNRYCFFPLLSFAWCLVWCATQSRPLLVRIIGICALLTMTYGVVKNWHLIEYSDKHFPEMARRLEMAPEGALQVVALYPRDWQLRLSKEGPICRYPPVSGLELPPQPVNGLQAAPKPVQTPGPLVLRGWIAAAERVESMILEIDGQLRKTVPLTQARPDIDRLWPFAKNPEKGWTTQLDLSDLAPGQHALTIRALEEHGCRAEVEAVAFTKLSAGK